MLQQILRVLSTGSLLLILCTDALAQTKSDSTAAPSEQDILAVFMMRFSLFPPDSTFVPMGGGQGWEEKSTEAKIMCSALPAPYEQVVRDADRDLANSGGKLLSRDTVELLGVKGFIAKVEFLPPPGGTIQEPFWALMYMRPWTKNITLNINAIYPKSQDARLYPMMLASFATVRKE